MPSAINSDDFEAKVTNAEGLVLVDFWADWCPPCHALAPILEQVEDELNDRITIYKVDVQAHQQLAAEHNVMALPTTKLYKTGKVVNEWVGVQPKTVFTKAVEEAE